MYCCRLDYFKLRTRQNWAEEAIDTIPSLQTGHCAPQNTAHIRLLCMYTAVAVCKLHAIYVTSEFGLLLFLFNTSWLLHMAIKTNLASGKTPVQTSHYSGIPH